MKKFIILLALFFVAYVALVKLVFSAPPLIGKDRIQNELNTDIYNKLSKLKKEINNISTGTTSGGGSLGGTVNASAQENVGYYATAGSTNIISGNNNFTFNGTTATVVDAQINSAKITGSLESVNFYPGNDRLLNIAGSGMGVSLTGIYSVGTDSRTAVDIRTPSALWATPGITEFVLHGVGDGDPANPSHVVELGYQSFLNATYSLHQEAGPNVPLTHTQNMGFSLADHNAGIDREAMEISGYGLNDANASMGSVLFGGFAQKTSESVVDYDPINAIILRPPILPTNGYKNSHALLFSGTGFNTTNHRADWRFQTVLSSQDATSDFVISSQLDAVGFSTRAKISDSGLLSVSSVALTSLANTPLAVNGSGVIVSSPIYTLAHTWTADQTFKGTNGVVTNVIQSTSSDVSLNIRTPGFGAGDPTTGSLILKPGIFGSCGSGSSLTLYGHTSGDGLATEKGELKGSDSRCGGGAGGDSYLTGGSGAGDGGSAIVQSGSAVAGTSGNVVIKISTTSGSLANGDIRFQVGDTLFHRIRGSDGLFILNNVTIASFTATGNALLSAGIRISSSVVLGLANDPGTAGQVFTSGGTGTDSSWTTPGTIKAGTSVSSVSLSGAFYQTFTSTSNAAATDTILYTKNISSNTLSTNGQAISFEASGTFAGTIAVDKRIKIVWGGTTVFDSGNLAITSASEWTLSGECYRTSATTQKCKTSLNTSFASLGAYADYAAAGLTLANNNTLTLNASGTNAADVTAEIFAINWRGAGPN